MHSVILFSRVFDSATSYFTRTGSIKDLLLCLDKGVPVPLGVAYKAGGHYVCAVGYKSDGVLQQVSKDDLFIPAVALVAVAA